MTIPVNRPVLDGNESKYLLECIESGWISSEGPFVSKFEEAFALKVDRKHGIAVSSGTAALDIAFDLFDLKPGDEVIVPAFTIISCLHQIIRRGATPVLVDSDPITWNMDVSKIAGRITSRTRAILAVHTYGLPVDMDEITSIADLHGLIVIEDAAEAHGLFYKGRPCGSFGDISIFSFYPNKLITTGEGGMLVTDIEALAIKARSLRNLCFQQPRYVHEQLGWNYRMTNLQAAVGFAQLERWDEFLARKKQLGTRYTELLSDLKDLRLPAQSTPFSENVYWVYGIVLQNDVTSNEFCLKLNELGIGTRSFFCPMHLQPVLTRLGLFANESYPVAEHLWKYGFYVPSGVGTSDSEIEETANAIRKVVDVRNYSMVINP